jgi:DNA polymerase-3 subunit beta
MKLECSIEKIKDALITAERITGKNLTLPVLGSVLWVASNKVLKLRATNLNIGIEIEIPAKIETEGVVAVKGDILSSLFSLLHGDSTVKFELIDSNFSVKTKSNNILLNTIPYEDFPTIPILSGEEITVPSVKLVEGLRAVYYSAAVSDIKPEIGSVYIYPQDDMLVFVATDSFRLAEKKVKIKKELSFDGILLPLKNASEIIRILDGVNDDVKIIIHKNQISLSVNGIYITSRVVDGAFPDYKQIIPRESKTQATLLKQDLLYAIKVSNILSDKFNQITFNLKPGEKVFEVDSKNNDIGENTTHIESTLVGEDVSVNINYKYIVDCFQSINGDSVTLELNGSNRPIIIRVVGDSSFMYLVMPMNRQ